jgi:hypothetical protein
MEKGKRWTFLLVGAVAVLVIGLIGSIALAQEATPEAETPAQSETIPDSNDVPSLRGFGRWGGLGRHGDSNWLTYLAEALGITVDELEDAQERAYGAWLGDAVEQGQLTQEQADELLATRALRAYVDKEAVLAEALGMTVEELETALAAQSLSDLMTERSIDTATLQANAQAAYEAAVQRAMADGVITQAQADEMLNDLSFNQFGHGEFGGHHGGRGRHGGRGGGFSLPEVPDSATPESGSDTADTNFDA